MVPPVKVLFKLEVVLVPATCVLVLLDFLLCLTIYIYVLSIDYYTRQTEILLRRRAFDEFSVDNRCKIYFYVLT